MPEVSVRVRSVALVVATVLAVTVVAGCTSESDVQSGDNQGFVSGSGTSDVIAVADREVAPDVSGTTLDGAPISLSDYAGDVVVLNVWGSWCAPCRAEAPALQEVYKTNRDRGVQFVGINTRDQEAAAKAFEDNFDITYPSFVDTSGEIQLQFRDTLPPSSIPSTVVIDREGRVAARVIGQTTYSQLSDIVHELASEK